jgi:hypothetical protein
MEFVAATLLTVVAVIPAQAGIQQVKQKPQSILWIPACAGMTI